MSLPQPRSTSEQTVARQRLISLDALRGFDMFWIIGGKPLLIAFAAWTGSTSFLALVREQTRHTPWQGFTAWDLIFPLFMFMAGVTMPYAITSKLQRGEGRWPAYRRLIRRMVLLVLIGLSFTALRFEPEEIKPYNVLGLIGVGYFIAGVVVIHRPVRSQCLWAVGMLLGYWAALVWLPVPGYGAGVLTPTGNFTGFLDRNLIPGKLHMSIFDPEGTIRVFPAAAMALIGAGTGHLLRNSPVATYRNVGILFVAGAVLVPLGYAWDQVLPIVKPLWSSSYIVLSAGYSLLLLALFYLVIDVWQQRWLGWLFLPIGMNAITIYAGVHYFDFAYTADFFFGGFARWAGADLAPLVLAAGVLIVEWTLLYFLYRKNVFLRV
ncbi:acyltransferase family protein [Roseimaritima sediminicola]|uniref:acyltransferase family protein n=1 Tax=Roseimaritima sediminicola TaxID=2662066 RepID=UPI0012983E49|nr:DUF5009 domain-containing protein [Roseimaritima sediminicola]